MQKKMTLKIFHTCPQDPMSRLFAVFSPLVESLVQVAYCGTNVTTQSNIRVMFYKTSLYSMHLGLFFCIILGLF